MLRPLIFGGIALGALTVTLAHAPTVGIVTGLAGVGLSDAALTYLPQLSTPAASVRRLMRAGVSAW